MRSIDRRHFAAVIAASTVAGCLDDEEEIDESAWDDVSEISLVAHADRWEGESPEMIAGDTNPTLVLIEGREYEVTWENTSGISQNLEFRDADGNRIAGTETNSSFGATETLTIEATPEIIEYISFPREATLVGEVNVIDG